MFKGFRKKVITLFLICSIIFTGIIPTYADELVPEVDITSETDKVICDELISEETEYSTNEFLDDITNKITEDNDSQKSNDIHEKCRIYEGENYKAIYTLFSSWDGGSNFQIKVENTGDKKIENWSLLVEYKDEINNIWNAQIVDKKDGKYKIKNIGWNQDIEIGQAISFGMSASASFTEFPASIILLNTSDIIKTDGVEIYYEINNRWEKGCKGSIVIKNLSDVSIEEWTVEFDCTNGDFTFWDGVLSSKEDNHYIVHNADYNSVISPGKSVSVGFLMSGDISENMISGLAIKENTEQIPGPNIESDPTPDKERDAEKLEDIGENYFKQPSLEDIVYDNDTGIKYVKNQLLVSAYMGTPKEAIFEIAEELGAEIVGYTAITCDYQFEFTENQTMDDLDTIAEYLLGYPYISSVFLNTVVETSVDETTNDYFYMDSYICEKKSCDANGDGDTNDDEDFHYVILSQPSNGVIADDWNENTPSGDNWGLEAMHVPSAWDLVTDSHTVKVGIIDSYFEDVITPTGKRELVFDDVLRNRLFNPKKHSLAHGDHVAGIIGANHNNGFGTSGVATDVRLYGYTMSESELDASNGVSINCMAGVKVALSTLVCNHIKIINMSLGYGDESLVYGASRGNQKAINQINEDVSIATDHLRKLLNAGYDFLIVKSAGNYNGHKFVADNSTYGYHKYDSSTDSNATAENKEVSAEYGYFINAISDKEVKDHIIIVGAFDVNNSIASFSGRGSRVDVVAPGVDILSTAPRDLDLSLVSSGPMPVPGFKIMSGTSMATPYISGIATLMYQVRPSLSAKKVKEFICSDSFASKKIYNYNVPDAKLCVEKAKSILDTTSFDNDWPTGLAAGAIRDSSGNKISHAKFHVQAIRHTTGNYNLDRYAFNFDADTNGDFLYPLPQGTYDFLVYIDIDSNKYLPAIIKDIEILPDQTNYMETIRLASWTARTSGNVKGIINNAITGSPLAGVTARIRKGWNAISGAYVTNLSGKTAKEATSAIDGTFSISAAIGTYTVELKKPGYVTAYYNVLATQGNAVLNGYDVSMSMTPILSEDEYRIVLTWGNTPSDLDSHLIYYQEGAMKFHVYYRNKNAYVDGERVAWLDLDDTSSYGPETVTITVKEDLLKNGELRYCVHNYSGGLTGLSSSNASVRIYKGNQLKKTYSVTQNQQALVWHVFSINKDGIKIDYTYDNSIN